MWGCAGVSKPIAALTRAIFEFGVREGVLQHEFEAMDLAYEVLINCECRA